jgi:hypothetical protein
MNQGPTVHENCTIGLFIKLSVCLIKLHDIKTNGKEEIQLHSFLMEVSVQLHALATLSPGKEPLDLTEQESEWDPEPVWSLLEREPLPCWELIPVPRSSSP